MITDRFLICLILVAILSIFCVAFPYVLRDSKKSHETFIKKSHEFCVSVNSSVDYVNQTSTETIVVCKNRSTKIFTI